MKSCYLAGLLASLSLVAAQSASATESTDGPDPPITVSTDTAAATNTAYLSVTAVATDEPCAIMSSQFAQQTGSASPSVAADIVNACQLSVPIVKQDSLNLIDGIVAALQFQSDLGVLKSPPEGYLMAGVDLLDEMRQIRDNVESGVLTSEIEFERNVTLALAKAHDGHLQFYFDGMIPFTYNRPTPLISVSADGKELPKLYPYYLYYRYVSGAGEMPAEIIQINGEDAAEFLQRTSQNVTYGPFQDPDALYNYQLNGFNNPNHGAFSFDFIYQGANTSLTFANGVTNSFVNQVTINPKYTLTGLTDGASYYNIFCNATQKNQASSSNSLKTLNKARSEYTRNLKSEKHYNRVHLRQEAAASSTYASSMPSATQIAGYPSPIVISPDLSISGYFLTEPGFENTAVLVITEQSYDTQPFQATMRNFLEACRNANKSHLVLDLQGNGGGNIATGYDVFRQLFPDLYPYAAGTLRAHEGLNLLGQFYTLYSSKVLQQADGNETLAVQNGYNFEQYNALATANDSGQLFQSWPELYGPVETAKENYTNLVRWNINDTNFDISRGLLISGVGELSNIAPSPFTSDNIIMLTDGRCSSTCTTLSHLLKWQGKVKSITMGGRPQIGAMQAVGGVKGREVYSFRSLYHDVSTAYQVANSNGYPDFAKSINESSLSPILNNGEYVILRGGTGQGKDFEVNFLNNVAESDSSYTPSQFVYEAADCRLWFQPKHIGNIGTLWLDVVAQAFGLNGTDVYSMCVEGSTNQPSSLSGDATLYNNGVGNNVTNFQPEQGNGSTSYSGNSSSPEIPQNGVGRSTASSVVLICAFAAALFML